MNGSDLLLHCLRTEGCDALFTVPDREVLPILEAAARSGVQVVVHHQQQHAGLAAAAYGCGTRRPGYVVVGPAADPALLDTAAQVLGGAHRAVILAGHGVLRSGAHLELQALAEQGGLPVVTTVMGKAAIPFDHSHCVGVLGTGGPAERVLRECDTVLAVGYDQEEWPADGFNATLDKRIIFLVERPLKADVHFGPEVEVLGDLNAALSGLAQRVGQRTRRGWDGVSGITGEVKRQVLQEMEDVRHNSATPVHPGRLAMELRLALDKHDILVADVGAHREWLAHIYPVHRPGTFYTSNCFETMGSALPMAIGLALVFGQHHRVVACMGDGGYLAASSELETANRLRLPLTVVVASDDAYGQTKVESLHQTGQAVGTSFAGVDIAAHARALGPTACIARAPASWPMSWRQPSSMAA